MAFPELPGQIRRFLDKNVPGFWNWYQDALQYWRKSAIAVEGLPLPSGSVVSETTLGQSPSAGSATTYSRGDHTHGTPSAVALRLQSPDGTWWEITVEDDGALTVTEV